MGGDPRLGSGPAQRPRHGLRRADGINRLARRSKGIRADGGCVVSHGRAASERGRQACRTRERYEPSPALHVRRTRHPVPGGSGRVRHPRTRRSRVGKDRRSGRRDGSRHRQGGIGRKRVCHRLGQLHRGRRARLDDSALLDRRERRRSRVLRRGPRPRLRLARGRARPGRKEPERIHVALGIGGESHAEVDVRPGVLRLAARAEHRHGLGLGHGDARVHGERAEMKERDGEPVRRLDRHRAPAAGHRAGEAHRPARRGAHRHARRPADVQPAVEPRAVRVSVELERS